MQKESGSEQYAVLANRIRNSVEQYRAKREVERTERRLWELTESMNDCIWMFDREWEEFLFVSGYEAVWDRPESAIREDPRDFLNAVHPEDRERVRRATDRVSNGEPADIECRVLGDDGERGWVRTTARPIFDGEGDVVRVAGFTREITDRKDRERERERTIEFLQTLYDVATDTGAEAERRSTGS